MTTAPHDKYLELTAPMSWGRPAHWSPGFEPPTDGPNKLLKSAEASRLGARNRKILPETVRRTQISGWLAPKQEQFPPQRKFEILFQQPAKGLSAPWQPIILQDRGPFQNGGDQ